MVHENSWRVIYILCSTKPMLSSALHVIHHGHSHHDFVYSSHHNTLHVNIASLDRFKKSFVLDSTSFFIIPQSGRYLDFFPNFKVFKDLIHIHQHCSASTALLINKHLALHPKLIEELDRQLAFGPRLCLLLITTTPVREVEEQRLQGWSSRNSQLEGQAQRVVDSPCCYLNTSSISIGARAIFKCSAFISSL